MHYDRGCRETVMETFVRIGAIVGLCLSLAVFGCNSRNNGGGDSEPRLVIIDDDNGMARDRVAEEGSYTQPLARFTDSDGGMEILYVLGDPDIEVLGLT